MKKHLFLTLLLAGLGFVSYAQSDYKNAIGIRLAPNSYYDFFAFSYKGFVTDAGAIEINAGGGSERYYYGVYNAESKRPFSLSVSGAYQHHFKIPVQGLRWFIGGGLTGYNAFSSKNEYKGFGFGFFPTGGIDWKIPKVPINLTADYRPTIFVTRPDIGDSFEAGNAGIAVRYTIGQR